MIYDEMRNALDLQGGRHMQSLTDAFLELLLVAAPPGLRSDATEWGWDDTEVRSTLASHASQILLGRPWPTFGEEVEIDAFITSLMAAHRERYAQQSG